MTSRDRPGGFPDVIAIGFEKPRAQVAAVERGAADIAVLPREIRGVTALRTRYGARLHTDPAVGFWMVFLNVLALPFDDARVRQALNYAVDPGRVAELARRPPDPETHVPAAARHPGICAGVSLHGEPEPGWHWIGPDLARSRRLAAASGTRGMKVEFWGAQPSPQIGRYFGSLLAELGHRSELLTYEDLHLIFENAAGEPRPRPQLGLWGWGAGSPFGFVDHLASCGSPYNLSGFCGPKLDALMERAARARGPEATALWRRVETSLADQAPTVPLVSDNNISLTADRVGNYQYHPLWGPLIEQLWVR